MWTSTTTCALSMKEMFEVEGIHKNKYFKEKGKDYLHQNLQILCAIAITRGYINN
jgi:hypothetical protein